VSKKAIHLIGLVFVLWTGSLSAQEVILKAKFNLDTIKIGEVVPLSFSITYPETSDVVLPDSTFQFTPFTYNSYHWFPTKYANGILTDSVVYYLSTFELDQNQYVELSAIEVQGKDSITHSIATDSVSLRFIVEAIPDSLADIKLMENTNYYRVPPVFNTTFASVVIVLLFFSLLILWVIFGKKISVWWKIRTMNKEFFKFNENYNLLKTKITQSQELSRSVEDTIIFWKKYMEKLENLPYRKLATAELNNLKKEEDLLKNLRTIDKAIYSKSGTSEVIKSLSELQEYSSKIYHDRIEELKHGVSN